MSRLVKALVAVVALVALCVSPVSACTSGDGSVVGGTTFSIVQQPVYAQAIQAPVYAQAVVAAPVYSQAIVGGYAPQAIVVRRSIFPERVVVRRRGALNVRVGY